MEKYLTNKRSSAEILYEVLAAARFGGVNKRAIAYQSRVTDRQASRYISLLCDGEYMERTAVSTYRLTAKGERALEQLGNAFSALRGLIPTEREAVPAFM